MISQLFTMQRIKFGKPEILVFSNKFTSPYSLKRGERDELIKKPSTPYSCLYDISRNLICQEHKFY